MMNQKYKKILTRYSNLHVITQILILVGQFRGLHLESCSNVPPGINRMSLGIDITELDLRSNDQTSTNGFKDPVFQWNCSKGDMWVNHDGQSYQKPDQIGLINSLSSGTESSIKNLMKTRRDVQLNLKTSAGVDVFFKGMFSSSASYNLMASAITDRHDRVSEVGAEYTTREARLDNHVPLSRLVLDRIDRLSIDPVKHYADYESFFAQFGTHLWKRVLFGGSIRAIYETRESYHLAHTDEEIMSQSQSMFFGKFMVSLGYQNEIETATVDERFFHETSNTTIYMGGNVNFLGNMGFDSWYSTIHNNPSILGGTLVPIWQRIEDPTKKAAMKTAFEIYLTKKSLLELNVMLEYKVHVYAKNRKDTQYLTNFLEEIDTELSRPAPNLTKMHLLEEDINFDFVIPNWWEDTLLCLEPYNRHSDLSCSAKQDLSCPYSALTNRYTPAYTDNMDDVNCKIEMSIFTPLQSDQWWNKVEFCMRRFGDGCWDYEEICTHANQFLRSDMHRLANRDDPCRASWMLKTGDQKVPEWFKNYKFCFLYSAIGADPENYGSLLCSNLNEWTPDYGDKLKDNDECCDLRFAIRNTILNENIFRPITNSSNTRFLNLYLLFFMFALLMLMRY